MREEVRNFYNPLKDVFGLPQVYRGIDFYPIHVGDSDATDAFYKIMTYPKNSISDREVIRMSYFKFIIVSAKDRLKTTNSIIDLFKHITRSDKVDVYAESIDTTKPPSMVNSTYYIRINNVSISEWEFEDLREIILEQNGLSIEFVNDYNPELERKLNQIHLKSDMDVEDEIFTLSVLMGKLPSELRDLTLYQLQNIFERSITLKQFDIYEPLLKSGNIKMLGGDLRHYLYHRHKKGRYDDILIQTDRFLEKNKDVFSRK